MNFKHSVIGDNTPENIKHLELLGYEKRHINNGWVTADKIVTYGKRYSEFGRSGFPYTIDSINCLGNPELFKAVTAMRDDSDYMQWFTDTLKDDWVLSNGKTKYFDERDNTYHKATLEELIEHF